jgi:hypothetical protein
MKWPFRTVHMLSFGEFFPSLVDHTKKIWQPWCRPMHFCCSPFTKDFEIQSQRREINGNAGSDLNKKKPLEPAFSWSWDSWSQSYKARDRFYKTSFRPKTLRKIFHPQTLDKFPPICQTTNIKYWILRYLKAIQSLHYKLKFYRIWFSP